MEFKKLDKEGLKTLIHWAELEDWNPGIQDVDLFWATDPDGFYGYFDGDTLMGGGSLVSYGGKFGFMGLFIVKPEYRSAGKGRALWFLRRDTLLSRLEAGAAIGMDGVVAMQPFYQKGGFEIAFRDERYEKTGELLPVDNRISAIEPDAIAAILAYDTDCFGFARPAFIQTLITQNSSKSFQFIDNSTLKGFAIMRRAVKGYRIGPLFADNPEIAEALYQACLNAAPGESIYLDIPVVNTGAVALVKKLGAICGFECARMYYGNAPKLNPKVFGITTLELG